MKQLKYTVKDSTIVELLGIQNFTSSESAVLELVKNSYDARALNLHLFFHDNVLEIIDDGIGMDLHDIENNWMNVGDSDKQTIFQVEDFNKRIRIVSGSKGIGRFALSRLGSEIKLYSKKNNSLGIIWETNWSSSTVDNIEGDEKSGTKIVISKLRENWTSRRIINLCDYLEVMYNDTAMSIKVSSVDLDRIIPPHFAPPKLGVNCKSCIKLNYDNSFLRVVIDSDEFLDEAMEYCNLDVKHYEENIDLFQELKSSNVIPEDPKDLKDKLKRLGKFDAVFYFNTNALDKDKELFLYKYIKTNEKITGGIVLYRNAFSISSFDGNKDWLGLSKRSRKSTAAATHETGAWRVRENQLSGYVNIDKKNNSVLKDLANRQGVEEDDYYQIFVQSIICGIAVFERFRQRIIRQINKKNKEETLPETPITDIVLKNPSKLKKLSDKEKEQFVQEIKENKDIVTEFKIKNEEVENKYKYDVRILNVLATIGLKASSIAHDLNNDRSIMGSWYDYVVDALKKYEVWDYLNAVERTQKSYANVPLLLETGSRISKKISSFMTAMLEKIQKDRFEVLDLQLYNFFETLKNNWIHDYAWLVISVDVPKELTFNMSYDSLQVIFDNLILNTVQQNSQRDRVEINISLHIEDTMCFFEYSDNGVGLDKKYEHKPERILEVHETTRKDGHGLGMWIVNNTISMLKGKIIKIDGNHGFYISFSLGEMTHE